MKSSTHITIFIMTVIMVLMISAVMTVPAQADGETPPPPTDVPTDVAPPPADLAPAPSDPVATPAPVDQAAPAPTDVVTTDTPVVDSSAPTDAAATSTPVADTASAATDVPTATDTTPTDVLSQVPDNTKVVVTDASGNTLPLATQDAAQAIATGDPIWCPVGVAVPKPKIGGCTDSYATIALLLTDPKFTGGGPAQAGVIWIEKTYAGADNSPVIIDGSALTTMANYALTLKGGWNGCSPTCVATIDTSTPSAFDVSLSVINWNADVTLSDIVISGVTGAGSTALTIGTTKKVTLNRVKVQNNAGSGARIDNTAGVGDVLITFSQFLSNAGGIGLEVDSRGAITLSNVFVNSNGAGGANLDNSTAAVVKNVTINTGANQFNNNTGVGLSISSRGAIIFKDIDVNGNTGAGALLDNTPGSAGVTMTGTNVFTGNTGGRGLEVRSDGAIVISNLIANLNSGTGARLDNCQADVGGTCTTTTVAPVTLTGHSEFKFDASGLMIASNGAITMSNIAATNSSGGPGIWINNETSPSSANVTMTGTNIFTDNASAGLFITSRGAITLSNISAIRNGFGDATTGFGAEIVNDTALSAKPITLTGTNIFNDNNLIGLWVVSNGAITINELRASSNGTIGAELNNINGVSPITLTGTQAVFNDNSTNGLRIFSHGAVTITSLTANNNGNRGAYIQNDTGIKNVTLKGVNNVSGNGLTGLAIFTNGAITINSLNASGNGTLGTANSDYGAFLDNCRLVSGACTATTPTSITLTGINVFNGNHGIGLVAESLGAIKINALTANGSTNDGGAYLFNQNGTHHFNITLTGSNNFENNAGIGLRVFSNGSIIINNLTANSNTGGGAILDAYDNAAGFGHDANIILTGTNIFNGNGVTGTGSGLKAYSNSIITLNNLIANNNQEYGVYLDNTVHGWRYPFPAFRINITGTNLFNGNGKDGLYFIAKGSVNLSRINADGNTGSGVNGTATSYTSPGGYFGPANIVLSCGSMTNNGAFGYTLTADNHITLKGVFGFGNTSGNTPTTASASVSIIRTCP